MVLPQWHGNRVMLTGATVVRVAVALVGAYRQGDNKKWCWCLTDCGNPWREQVAPLSAHISRGTCQPFWFINSCSKFCSEEKMSLCPVSLSSKPVQHDALGIVPSGHSILQDDVGSALLRRIHWMG